MPLETAGAAYDLLIDAALVIFHQCNSVSSRVGDLLQGHCIVPVT
jgi:hypothetical protein